MNVRLPGRHGSCLRASRVTTLSLLNAVAATMPSAEAQALAQTPGVKAVVPDGTIIIGDATSTTPTVAASQVGKSGIPPAAADGQQLCNAYPNKPLIEPEALTSIHDASDNPNDPFEASKIATGQGVIVGNVDANSLAGNPNMIRPNGQHVIIDAPNPNENVFSDEFNGDVSTIAAQGTVTYTYASQLPFSNLPAKCSFRIVGDATGASLLSTGSSPTPTRPVRSWLPSRRSSPDCSRRSTRVRTSSRSPTALALCRVPTTTCSSRRTTPWCSWRRGGRERGRQRLVRNGRGSRR